MTDRTLAEIANAEVSERGSTNEQWLCIFGENDVELLPKNGLNTVLLKTDFYSEDNGERTIGDITVSADLDEDKIELVQGSNSVSIPADKHEHVLWSVYDDDEERLKDIFAEHFEQTVRKGVMDWFLPLFRDAREEGLLEMTEDGWIIDNEIVVKWNATNKPVEIDQAVTPEGNFYDNNREAREIEMSVPPAGEHVETPFGKEEHLTETEIEFLTTVHYILSREHGHENDDCPFEQYVADDYVSGFTDTKSGIYHAHEIQKHTLDELNVTDDIIERLWANKHDHTAVWEMAIRQDELIEAPVDVFTDVADDDEQRWRKIHDTKEIAKIPQGVKQSLLEMYE